MFYFTCGRSFSGGCSWAIVAGCLALVRQLDTLIVSPQNAPQLFISKWRRRPVHPSKVILFPSRSVSSPPGRRRQFVIRAITRFGVVAFNVVFVRVSKRPAYRHSRNDVLLTNVVIYHATTSTARGRTADNSCPRKLTSSFLLVVCGCRWTVRDIGIGGTCLPKIWENIFFRPIIM